MATIQSALKLSDGMTGPLQGITQSLNLVIFAIGMMQAGLEQDEKISEMAFAAKAALVEAETEMTKAIEDTIRAQEKLNEEFSMQPPEPSKPTLPVEPPIPPIPEASPVPAWKTWSSPEIFQSSGVDRYSHEIEALQAKMGELAASQQALDMSDTSFLPAGAADDINEMQQRLQRLGTLLQQVEMQKDNLGETTDPEAFDALNASVEKIRVAIQQAIGEQQSLNNAMKTADLTSVQDAYTKLNRVIDSTEAEIRNNTKGQERFNRMVENGEVAAHGLFKKIAGFIGRYANINAIKGFFSAAKAAANDQISAEQRLQTIMRNKNGMTQDGIELAKQRVRELEKTTAISAGVGIKGQIQLAEYVHDPSNIANMTEAMYNLATKTYGANVSAEQLRQTANLMGKVMMGDINALSSSGFRIEAIFTEAEQQLLKTGTEAERAALVIQMIDENLSGLAEAMGSTPEGQAIKLANAWGSVQEKIGYGLLPVMLQFMGFLMANMPVIETVFLNVFGTLIYWLTKAANFGMMAASFIVDNWSLIEPIIWGIGAALGAAVIALGAYNAVTAVKNTLMAISAARTALANGLSIAQAAVTKTVTGAQVGLNAAMMASPITWIILAVIALIALFYLIVAAINKFAGTSLSATGIIAGVFSTVGAVIANIFMGLLQLVFGVIERWYNWFAAIANFLGNVFNDPIGSAIKLFGDLADNVLGILQRIASAMDFVFGTSMADTVQGWRSDLEDLTQKVMEEYGNGTYEEHFGKLDIDNILDDIGLSMERFDYGDAYQAGYDWGEGLGSGPDLDQFKMPEIPGASAMPNDLWGIDDSTVIDGGKLDEVGNIKNSVDISSEDLKAMRELAEMKSIQNFVTLTPSISFGDTHVRNESDLDTIVARFTEKLQEDIAVSANAAYR